MFYYLKGELAHRENGLCVIDCGGVGFKLGISIATSSKLSMKNGKDVPSEKLILEISSVIAAMAILWISMTWSLKKNLVQKTKRELP